MLGHLFGYSSHDRLRELFADQFTPDGKDFIYRRNMRGPAYRVSAAERDAFVDDYARNWVRFAWAAVGGTVIMIMGITAAAIWLVDIAGGAQKVFLAILTGSLVLLILIGSNRLYAAPARALERRTPAADALSPEARRKLLFTRLTWGQLGAGAVTFAVIPLHGITRGSAFIGWNRLWLIVGAAGLLLTAVQAFRKWRFDRQG